MWQKDLHYRGAETQKKAVGINSSSRETQQATPLPICERTPEAFLRVSVSLWWILSVRNWQLTPGQHEVHGDLRLHLDGLAIQ